MRDINGVLPIYYWSRINNFGDQMSKDILEYFLSEPTKLVDEKYCGKLVAIGSVLDKCRSGDVVWGAGVHPRWYSEPTSTYNYLSFLLSKIRHADFLSMKFLAVRGPITQQFILQNGGPKIDVLGDPAILAPILYAKKRNPIRKHLLINHFSVVPNVGANIHSVATSESWQTIVDEICASEVVISSSLHGIILAETYGVPAILLRNSREGLIKYIDYYGATERFPIIENSIDAAIAKTNYQSPPSFESLGRGLLVALDAWHGKKSF